MMAAVLSRLTGLSRAPATLAVLLLLLQQAPLICDDCLQVCVSRAARRVDVYLLVFVRHVC